MPATNAAELVTLKDAAAALGLTTYSTQKAAAAGRIKAVARPGEPMRYDLASVRAYAEELRRGPTLPSAARKGKARPAAPSK